MDIQFINQKEWGIKTQIFRVCSGRLKKFLPETDGVLNVIFTDDTYIHELNKKYRKKDKPTDVLSFSYIEETGIAINGLIGEIYISVPTAERQAPEYGNTLSDELKKLFVHGFLHIFGYDHETDEEYKEMSEVEKEMLS